jgi:hypothetical protein
MCKRWDLSRGFSIDQLRHKNISKDYSNDVCAFSGKRRSRRQRGACGDFVNLVDLPAQSSKMLLGVGLRACIHRDECACVVSAFDVLCNSQKA